MRRWRGRAEIAAIEALEPDAGGSERSARARSSGSAYERGDPRSCRPQQFLRLHRSPRQRAGTCKHIEGVLAALETRRGARGFKAAAIEAARVEIFLGRRHRGSGTPLPTAGRGSRKRAPLSPASATETVR